MRAPASGHRPAVLDDPAWLRRRYAADGDTAIARELGVSRATVQRARLRLGIESRPRGGSDRGRAYRCKPQRIQATPAQLANAYEARERGVIVPTPHLIVSRAQAFVGAVSAQDGVGEKDTLRALASAARLRLEHLDRLEAA